MSGKSHALLWTTQPCLAHHLESFRHPSLRRIAHGCINGFSFVYAMLAKDDAATSTGGRLVSGAEAMVTLITRLGSARNFLALIRQFAEHVEVIDNDTTDIEIYPTPVSVGKKKEPSSLLTEVMKRVKEMQEEQIWSLLYEDESWICLEYLW